MRRASEQPKGKIDVTEAARERNEKIDIEKTSLLYSIIAQTRGYT